MIFSGIKCQKKGVIFNWANIFHRVVAILKCGTHQFRRVLQATLWPYPKPDTIPLRKRPRQNRASFSGHPGLHGDRQAPAGRSQKALTG